MSLYPIFLSLTGCRCLVVGFGSVGQRKVSGLLKANPEEIVVMDKTARADLELFACDLLLDERVRYVCREVHAQDIAGYDLVFAATDSAEENTRIVNICRKAKILCNSATAPEDASQPVGLFNIPAVARSGSCCIALSTSGASPALARAWREELEEWLSTRAPLATILGVLRPYVLSQKGGDKAHAELFRKLADSPMGAWLVAGDTASCRAWLEAELPDNLKKHIDELMDSIANVHA